jgi:quercetin dioxygenase-like cupin family protein
MNVSHYFGGGAYAKESEFAAGEAFAQHSHPHDHLAILAFGTALVRVGDEVVTHIGPCCITMAANTIHGVEALTPIVWYCIWATEDTDPETVDATIMKGD